MEELKFSILVCAYKNSRQFSNFLWTACCQNFHPFEIIVVDNATPNDGIQKACEKVPCRLSKVRYFNIRSEEKKCRNISQGINLAAEKATGKYIVIVADSNTLLSFNLLESIGKLIDSNVVILSSGMNDVKISPNGNYDSEYWSGDPSKISRLNEKLLLAMGWPCDPINLDLTKVGHRFPPPHKGWDCYIVCLPRQYFLRHGGYDEKDSSWGEYHQNFVSDIASKLRPVNLKGVRIIHQFHRVFKDDSN
jgi:glycosyltransferase involved in cell wall biosynthesis